MLFSTLLFAINTPIYQSGLDARITTNLLQQLAKYTDIYIYGNSTNRDGSSLQTYDLSSFATNISLTHPYGRYTNGTYFRFIVPNFASKVALIAMNKANLNVCTIDFSTVAQYAYESNVEFTGCKSTTLSPDLFKKKEDELCLEKAKYVVKQLGKP